VNTQPNKNTNSTQPQPQPQPQTQPPAQPQSQSQSNHAPIYQGPPRDIYQSHFIELLEKSQKKDKDKEMTIELQNLENIENQPEQM
jgi:hypothetical protein